MFEAQREITILIFFFNSTEIALPELTDTHMCIFGCLKVQSFCKLENGVFEPSRQPSHLRPTPFRLTLSL